MSLLDSMIRPVYIHGIDAVQAVQRNFRSWEVSFHHTETFFMSIWALYFLYFPIIYYMNMRMGLRFLWSGAITHYVAVMFKQVLHGHRPYWWVRESPYHVITPHLRQYEATCYTTPGSPSDQLMVYSCVLFILVHHTCKCNGWTPTCQQMRYMGAWGAYYVLMVCASVVQVFHAAHFPHQCALGAVMGSMMARRFTRTNVLSISFPGFTWMMFFIMSSFSMLYGGLWVVGYDPTWAGAKAVQTCVKQSALDIFTNVQIEDVVKASAMIFGLGLSYRFFTKNAIKVTDGCLPRVKAVHMAVGIFIITVFDRFVHPPFGINPLFKYLFIFVKYAIVPILIITDIPLITGLSKVISSGIIDEDLSCLEPLEGNAFPDIGSCNCVPVPPMECCSQPEPDPCTQPRGDGYNYGQCTPRYRRFD